MTQKSHLAFAQRLETAHAALFRHIERHQHGASPSAYAEAGISLGFRPGVPPSVTLRPSFDTSGKAAPGLEIIAAEDRVAAYLLLDVIAAVNAGELDKVIKEIAACSAIVDYVGGYPTVLGWET